MNQTEIYLKDNILFPFVIFFLFFLYFFLKIIVDNNILFN